MYEVSQDQWDHVIPSYSDISQGDDKVGLRIATSIADPQAPDQFKSGYSILGLYYLLTRMISHRELYEVEVVLRMRGYEIGNIEAMGEVSTALQASNVSALAADNGTALKNTLGIEMGFIVDAAHDLRIDFDYDDTMRIKSQDLFLAFLDGLATAAEPDKGLPCNFISGMSPWSVTGKAVINMSAKSGGTLSYNSVKLVLFLVWEKIVLTGQRFGDMQFALHHGNVLIGQGTIRGVPPPSNIKGTAAAAITLE